MRLTSRASRLGLKCSVTVTVVIESMSAGERPASAIARAHAFFRQIERGARV